MPLEVQDYNLNTCNYTQSDTINLAQCNRTNTSTEYATQWLLNPLDMRTRVKERQRSASRIVFVFQTPTRLDLQQNINLGTHLRAITNMLHM